jgi:hypothetical protein
VIKGEKLAHPLKLQYVVSCHTVYVVLLAGYNYCFFFYFDKDDFIIFSLTASITCAARRKLSNRVEKKRNGLIAFERLSHGV